MEGNTYSFLETERLLRLGAEADGRATEETLMILNHKAAIEMLVEDADVNTETPLTLVTYEENP